MKVDNEHVQRRVFESARELLFSLGVKGWNMDMLAERSGLAKNTLYKIVGSKESLVEEVVLAQVRENAESIIAYVKEQGRWGEREAALDTLRRAIERFVANMGPFEPVILPQVYRQYPAIEPKVNALVAELSTLTHSYFEMGKERGLIRADADAEACMDVARGIVYFYIQQKIDHAVFEDRVKKVLEYVLTGILR